MIKSEMEKLCKLKVTIQCSGQHVIMKLNSL